KSDTPHRMASTISTSLINGLSSDSRVPICPWALLSASAGVWLLFPCWIHSSSARYPCWMTKTGSRSPARQPRIPRAMAHMRLVRFCRTRYLVEKFFEVITCHLRFADKDLLKREREHLIERGLQRRN